MKPSWHNASPQPRDSIIKQAYKQYISSSNSTKEYAYTREIMYKAWHLLQQIYTAKSQINNVSESE